MVGNEICDDSLLGGCLLDCSDAHPNYTCTSGSPTSPSVCTCRGGFVCAPVCGDGILGGVEVCDDNNQGGCLPDCSGSN